MLYIIIPTNSEDLKTRNRMVKMTRNVFPDARLYCIHDRYSQGKGWAVREGLKQAYHASKSMYDLFAYIDGDCDIHPCMLKKLRAELACNDIVVGRKTIKGLFMRKVITFLSRVYIANKFKIGVDTQTGVKLFRKHALFFTNENGFLFDIFMLKKAKDRGMKIAEVPVAATLTKPISLMTILCLYAQSKRLIRR